MIFFILILNLEQLVSQLQGNSSEIRAYRAVQRTATNGMNLGDFYSFQPFRIAPVAAPFHPLCAEC